MKVVQINAVCGYGSTGKIAVDISKLLNEKNIENYIFYVGKKNDYENGIDFADEKYLKIQALKSRVFGNYGFNSKYITKKMIAKLKEIKPDIVHLHNLHGHNVHLGILFDYLNNNDIQVIWTFHDCWSFTGYCTHFDYENCQKWQSTCQNCLQRKKYSWFFDRSNRLFNKKKSLYSGIKNLTVVTPSEWLGELVKKSFFKEIPVKIINNGIDLEIFKPTENNFKEKYSLQNKKIILGVASGISKRKGLEFFLELADFIDDDMQIVLVGLSQDVIYKLPKKITGLRPTSNQTELAEIYTAADVFLNCTLEDNFPTVNLEALACGTPVVTFKTGGSPEAVDENVGAVVKQGDVKEALNKIKELIKKDDISIKCREKAVNMYDKNKKFQEYTDLYFEVLNRSRGKYESSAD